MKEKKITTTLAPIQSRFLKRMGGICFPAILFMTLLCATPARADTVWQIGKKDGSPSGFALAPSGFKDFIEHDFGYEDKFFVINYSDESKDFPYVIPGPVDTWGGTWSTAGWRTHEVNILFGIQEGLSQSDSYYLTLDILDFAKKFLPKVKIEINGQAETIQLQAEGYNVASQKKPGLTEPISDTLSLSGDLSQATPYTIRIPVKRNVLKNGGNTVRITVLEGSWIMFDHIALTGPELELVKPEGIFIKDVRPAGYELKNKRKRFQPLLVDLEHLDGNVEFEVELDNKIIFQTTIEEGNYILEVPMPASRKKVTSKYRLFADGKVVGEGSVERSRMQEQTFADYVDTKMGSGHSRWMIAPGPWMPMSMVKVSPDNQNRGWQAGYQPSIESIGTFSHIHEWTMSGLGMMPANGDLQILVGDQLDPDSGYRSRIDKSTEEAPLGMYKVFLTDPEIWVETTATTRGGFFRYTFPQDKNGRVMIDLHIEAEYNYRLVDVDVKKVSDYRIEGYSHQLSPNVWSRDANQDYTVHFVIEFDRPIVKTGIWKDNETFDSENLNGRDLNDAGIWVEFDTSDNAVVQARTGISLVSIANASENLEQEITRPFGWSFESVVANQKEVWNDILGRVEIATSNRLEKERFYTNMYRSMCRNTWSDVNGEWISAGGEVQRFTNPDHVALGCDAFWNTFWNLNQFWNLVTPEWSSKWVNSQLAMYDADGWLAKGPAGMKYIPVMVAEHEIPLITGAYQMGIRDFDVEKAFEAVVKMQNTQAGSVAGGFAGNRDLVSYLEYGYVPSDKGRFSNTLEYSYDDWAVGQFAKALGKTKEYEVFSKRGEYWRNAVNPENGYAHLKESNGKFTADFDPFRSGANHHYVEGNAWQLSYFVPQDLPGLISIMGADPFVERLDWGFEASEPWRYNAPNDQYWDYPVVQGNQQSMHFAFLFNWAGRPWLTQKWSRSILDRYYGNGEANAYLGDEDQGQMSAWFVMAAVGLFQMDGGCSIDPIYEISSPLYEEIVINLGKRYGRGSKFVIEAKGASHLNKYVQSAKLNGKTLETFWFPASELLKGGKLTLEMGPEPNMKWGIGVPDR